MNTMKIKKISIIIDKKIFNKNDLDLDGDNINGPSLIKVPKFIKNPLGQYYLYFADHVGKYIRMAYSNIITGPYTLYKNGVLHLDNIPGYGHLACPDVHIDYKTNKQIIMYYHCPFNNKITPQSTFHAISYDGINFISNSNNIIYPYFRKFIYNNHEYGLAMKKDFIKNTMVNIPNFGISWKSSPSIDQKSVTAVLKKNKENWIEIGNILPFSRHTCVLVYNNIIYVFYSIVGDNPEHIKVGELIINEKNNNCNILNIKSIIKPELDYEHNNTQLIKSKYGGTKEFLRQLRDPYIIKDEKDIYILYTVCGEKGIAIVKIIL